MKILLLIIAMLLTSSAYADPDWNRGRGWNKNALKYYTNECVSTKMVDVQTEFAAKMLLDMCFEDVLAGRWGKKSKRKYLKEKENETIIIYRDRKRKQ
jgi:hypothetical protein